MDFIPRRLHAAIRQNLTVAQGNADVTQYVQAALDFVGCDTTKGGPVAPRALGSVHFPGGRCETAARYMPSLALKTPHSSACRGFRCGCSGSADLCPQSAHCPDQTSQQD